MPHYEHEGQEIPGTRHEQYDHDAHLAAVDIIAKQYYDVRDKVFEIPDESGLECFREYQNGIIEGIATDIPKELPSGN
jgi:hypothetical protein